MSDKPQVTLAPLEPDDKEQFILDNQWAFKHGATQEMTKQREQNQACLSFAESRRNSSEAQFGMRDDHYEEDDEIISRDTIEQSINHGEAYRILVDGKKVGGLVLHIEGDHGELELLFVSPKAHSKGIGYAAWCAVERLHPEVKVWETVTPYFEKRNIHFYVNKCGFHIVEFMWKDEEMFRFEKVIKQ